MDFNAGDVVLVRDRFADRARPAVVISDAMYNRHGDIVVGAITSHAARFPADAPLADWGSAGLKAPSMARMLLMAVAISRILLHIGHLTDRDCAEVKRRLRSVFGWV